MRKITSNAKIIKKAEPDFNNTFKIPKGSLSSRELLDIAAAFKTNMTRAIIAKFGEFGFQGATIFNMDAKIDAFEAGRAQQNTGKGGGVAATAETKAAIKRLKTNRRTLKTIGANILDETGNAGLIAEWKSACRIEKSKPTPPAPPAPPTT